jgi:hypothetical protein
VINNETQKGSNLHICQETRDVHIYSAGVQEMIVDLVLLSNLIRKRSAEIEKSVAGTGYLARTVIGVGTFLLDNEGNLDLLTANQQVIFEKFLAPLLGGGPKKAKDEI